MTRRDRYLRSPLNIRLALEAIRGLEDVAGAFKDVVIEVETALGRQGQNTEFAHHDWAPSQLKDIGAEVMAVLGASLRCRRLDELPHHREFRLEWADGSTCVVRPDQGITFVQTQRRERFNFGAPRATQADAVLSLAANVEKRDRAPVLVYVGVPSEL